MRLGVSFIAPRQLGAVGDQLGRQFLPSVRCTQPTVGASHVSHADRADDCWRWRSWLTGQSGTPPDSSVNFSHTPLSFF
jgi:hypothetical protein